MSPRTRTPYSAFSAKEIALRSLDDSVVDQSGPPGGGEAVQCYGAVAGERDPDSE